jgi:hypothetical protein
VTFRDRSSQSAALPTEQPGHVNDLGLVSLDDQIAPYDETLNTKKDKEIRLWAARVWLSRDAVRAVVGRGDAFLLLEIGQGVGDGLFTALVSFEVERFQELATAQSIRTVHEEL